MTGKGRCGVPKHFRTKCTNEVQLIEPVQEGNYVLEGKLWCR